MLRCRIKNSFLVWFRLWYATLYFCTIRSTELPTLTTLKRKPKVMIPQKRKLVASTTAAVICLILLPSCSVAGRFGFSPGYGGRLSKSVFIDQENNRFLGNLFLLRGGNSETLTLDEKVKRAMDKLGLQPPEDVEQSAAASQHPTTETTPTTNQQQQQGVEECKDGVCPMPKKTFKQEREEEEKLIQQDMDIETLGNKIADEMDVHPSLAMAALGATSVQETTNPNSRKYNEEMARNMIRQELDIIEQVSEDSAQVQQLVSEGYDQFLARRALAFSDMDMEDARAILLADKLDEEEEQNGVQANQQQEQQEEMKTVTVDSNFDPASIGMKTPAAAPALSAEGKQQNAPKPAKKENVVFEATTAQIQKLVLESPVPVLLDVYADWCGPCKVLGPALEDMAVKAGGIFRLVKVNSDNERPVSNALEVSALPTVFGFKNGKIENFFQGMPKSEEAMKNFMMGLVMPGGKFDPPVTSEQKQKFEELSSKLVRVAGAASFTFSQREVLQDRISKHLDALVEAQNGDLVDTEESVQILRSLLSNVIRDPSEPKFRKVNLANKVISAKITKFTPCIAILKSVGFVQEDEQNLVIGKGKKIINIAPLIVARDSLDKWIDQTRYDVAKAARKRRDEQELKRLQEEGAFDEDEDDDEEEDDKINMSKCELRVRLEGKKKFHDITLNADDPLSKVVETIPILANQGKEMRITCVAKRLIVNSADGLAMKKTLRDYGLVPAATVVVKVEGEEKKKAPSKSNLAERAAAQKKKKKGSHTMQSIGVYSSEDNAKGELIDGGGGVWYEHDVTSDEEEESSKDAESVEGTAEETENADADSESFEVSGDEQSED